MNVETQTICPRPEIILFIDGELSVREEELLEFHLLNCNICKNELNEQKQLLRAMNFALNEDKNIELPKDFAKVIAVRAESNVSGLRNKKERKIAFFSVTLMFTFALIGLSGKIESILSFLVKIGDELYSILSFSFHVFMDLFTGLSFIIKILSSKFIFSLQNSFILLFLTVFTLLALLFFAIKKRNPLQSDNV
jgi:hypothetical protein